MPSSVAQVPDGSESRFLWANPAMSVVQCLPISRAGCCVSGPAKEGREDGMSLG